MGLFIFIAFVFPPLVNNKASLATPVPEGEPAGSADEEPYDGRVRGEGSVRPVLPCHSFRQASPRAAETLPPPQTAPSQPPPMPCNCLRGLSVCIVILEVNCVFIISWIFIDFYFYSRASFTNYFYVPLFLRLIISSFFILWTVINMYLCS